MKISLTDMCFPQMNLDVKTDEPYHIRNIKANKVW
ncbi:AbaSI family restriction endonuclease [Clostridium punense]